MSVSISSPTISGLARKQDLCWQFAVRAVESRYRGSYLGMVWAILNPLLMLGIYFTLFGVIFTGRYGVLKDETPVDFAMAMFLGLTLYQLVAETLAASPLLIVGNANLVKKVVFPLEVLPLAQSASLWFNLAIGLVLALGGSLILGRGLSLAGLAWLPLILIPLLMLSAGLACFLAALGVFFRDLAQAMPFFAQVILYSSAVVYPLSRVPSHIWAILKWNPFLQTVVLAREVVLWGLPVNVLHLTYTYVADAAVLVAGWLVFLWLRPAFADVI
jgi:lipopolysaccharide transport system permease protein